MGQKYAKLVKKIEAPDTVDGLAVMDKKLYVLRKRASYQLFIYDTHKYECETTLTLDGYTPNVYNDMTECLKENCLFISDFNAKCIRRFDPKTKEGTVLAKLDCEPKGLSITPDGNLLVACNPNKLLELDVKTGAKKVEIELKMGMDCPKHAVKREDGQYVVCHATKDGLSRVCRVAADGNFRHCYGGVEGRDYGYLNCPCHLALKENDHVVVADNDNNRLVVLDSHLELVRYLVEESDPDREWYEFSEPHRLWFDTHSKRLYVGACTDKGVIEIFETSSKK